MSFMRPKIVFRFLVLGVIITITLLFLFTFIKLFSQPQNNFTLKTVAIFAWLKDNPLSVLLRRMAFWLNDLFHFNALRNKVSLLEQTNQNLLGENLQLQDTINQLLAQRDLAKIKQETNWHLIASQIIMMDPTGLSGRFWINKGQKDGVKPGMNVITADKILAGLVVTCSDHYCQVESIFAPQISLGVQDINSKVLGVLEKNKQGQYLLRLVPQNAPIQSGDILVTSVENKKFVKGLPVAQVKELIPSSNVLKEYVVEPLLNSRQLSQLFVITDFIPQNVSLP